MINPPLEECPIIKKDCRIRILPIIDTLIFQFECQFREMITIKKPIREIIVAIPAFDVMDNFKLDLSKTLVTSPPMLPATERNKIREINTPINALFRIMFSQ